MRSFTIFSKKENNILSRLIRNSMKIYYKYKQDGLEITKKSKNIYTLIMFL